MSLTVLLVRPAPPREAVGLQSFIVSEPLELEMLATHLEAAGHRVEILDMILEPDRRLESCVMELRPDLVGFTAYITHVGVVKAYARRLKALRSGLVTLAGGLHAEVNPEDFEDEALDGVVHVNGLDTLRELADALDRLDPADRVAAARRLRRELPGLWDGPGKPYLPDPRPPWPWADRGKTARYRHRYHYIFHTRCALLKTTAGCPYDCGFCYCVAITRGKVLERPMEDAVAELSSLAEDNVFIVDDNFLCRRERVEQFCRLVEAAGLRKRYILFGRADFIAQHPDLMARLATVGVHAVFVGVESFREEELQQMRKRVDVETNVRAIHILEGLGIEAYSGVIVGMDWTRADFDGLITHLRAFKRPLLNVQPLTPMPGTPFHDEVKERITVPRTEHGKWDMAHLLMEPTGMSRRAFYWNILRVYFKASANAAGLFYVLRRYGLRVYLRVLRGTGHISLQYLKLILRG